MRVYNLDGFVRAGIPGPLIGMVDYSRTVRVSVIDL